MRTTIIGVHGLNNKPEKELCRRWWYESIREGLRLNCGYESADFNFKMAYWSDLRYEQPRHFDDNNKDELFYEEKYVPAEPDDLKTYDQSMLDTIKNYGLHASGSIVDAYRYYFGKDTGVDLLQYKYPDLHAYYESEVERDAIRNRLKELLVGNSGENVIVIAHSMGTIIAHDVLSQLYSADNSFFINHLISMGSPLGFPLVKYKIHEEFGKITTPDSVTGKWINFSDRRDFVCFDEHLLDDFKENCRGIRVRDDLVCNDYPLPADSPNHHKVYGYLRTPEFSNSLLSMLSMK